MAHFHRIRICRTNHLDHKAEMSMKHTLADFQYVRASLRPLMAPPPGLGEMVCGEQTDSLPIRVSVVCPAPHPSVGLLASAHPSITLETCNIRPLRPLFH